MRAIELDRSPLPVAVDFEPDAQQRRVIDHRVGAMRVLAGPGTGKTATLVAALAARLGPSGDLKSDQVLGLTFGRKAAQQWRNRVSQAVPGAAPKVTTFHAFAYGLLRESWLKQANTPLRLLTGAEQQHMLKELFESGLADRNFVWPEDLAAAVGTNGLIEEVRSVLARARAVGLEPEQLAAIGSNSNRPELVALGQFMEQYLTVVDSAGVLDYAELIHRAWMLLESDDELRTKLQRQFRAIYVDEYQDTDPAQIGLLRTLVASDTSLIVVGDPDQAIYGFRGADERALARFTDDFAAVFPTGPVDVVLDNCRRFGAAIQLAGQTLIGSALPVGFSAAHGATHRKPTVRADAAGQVTLLRFDSEGAQAAHLADLIVREHANGRPWQDMAIVVRSAVVSLPVLQRSLLAAGIPIEVASDELPLHADPAVRPLVDALQWVNGERSVDLAGRLLAGPLGKLDSFELRQLAKFLRINAPTTASNVLLRDALANPDLAQVPPRLEATHAKLVNLAQVLTEASNLARGSSVPQEVLWHIWSKTTWGESLRQRALGEGQSALRANRDLDAILALFSFASRYTSVLHARRLTTFLADLAEQQIPSETTSEATVRSESVRLLTAHRAKGLQWPLVIVVGMQQDAWPDLRSHSSLLPAAQLGAHGIGEPQTRAELMQAERRLAFVAVTRAMEQLIVATVDAVAADGTRPSSFFTELETAFGCPGHQVESAATPLLFGVQCQVVPGRPKRPLTFDGVVASLRRLLSHPDAQLRLGAAARLAELAGITDSRGRPAFPAADPKNWWGMAERTTSQAIPIPALSASTISAIEDCPVRWFTEHEAQAQEVKGTAVRFGNVLHRIAQSLSAGEVTVDDVAQELERIWPDLGYEAPWLGVAELNEAKSAAQRLNNWLAQQEGKSWTEYKLVKDLKVELTTTAGTTEFTEIQVNGFADRILQDEDGVSVFDFKTQRKPPGPAEVKRNLQLALYLRLIAEGAGTKAGIDTRTKGAALIQLRSSGKSSTLPLPLVQSVTADEHDATSTKGTLQERLSSAAQIQVSERYEAKRNNYCNYCASRIMCPVFLKSEDNGD